MKQSFLFVVAICFLSSCNIIGGERVDGNGNLASENRHAGDFKNVSGAGPVDIVLNQSPNTDVQVSGDENLLQYITTETDGSTLKIKVKPGYDLEPKKHLQVRISAPGFKEISSAGSGNVMSENTLTSSDKMEFRLSGSGNMNIKVDAPSLESHTTGSGDITFSGKAESADISVAGSGNIHSFGLITQATEISITGSGDAEVYATRQLNVKVVGSGDVKYKGGASVDSHITGSGSASKED